MSVIERANLPQGKASAAVIGKCEKTLAGFISSFGVELIFAEENAGVDPAIKNHADVNVLYLGNGRVVLDESQHCLAQRLRLRGFETEFTSEPVCGEYPGDCRLNVALVGSWAFGRFDIADESVQKLKNVKKINVRQGYAKCSVCVVNGNALITDDPSIYKAALKEKLHVLLCEKGNVRLSGHDYGFIGGACALIEKDHLLFFGDITKHKSFDEIQSFLKNEGCRFSFLKGYPLTDIGGLVLLEEKTERRHGSGQ